MGGEIAVYRRHQCFAGWVAVCVALASMLALGSSTAAAQSPLQARAHIAEWPLTELGSNPSQIVAGSRDSAWFINNIGRGNVDAGTDFYESQVDRIDGSGMITPYTVGGGVSDVARGAGGISFVGSGYVGRIAPGGQVQEFPVQTGPDILSIAFGAGGYLWLTKGTEHGHDAIQRISSDDVVKAFALKRGSGPRHITRGTDGAMWFTEYNGERITSTGKITEFPLSVRAHGEAQPVQPIGQIAAGADGDIWFVTFGAIGRLSRTSGKLTLFYRRDVSEPLVAGPNGSIWFTEDDKIGRISPNGRFSKMIRLPRGTGRVRGLAAGADGSIWYTAERPSVVGRITFGG